MNEYPKRIWIDNTILDEFDMERCPESDIPYIRADIVDELVEACIKLLEDEADIIFRTDLQSTYKCIGRLNVALLKLEESHE